MKRLLVIAFLGAVCIAPGVASATVLTDVTAVGDCDGWSLEVSIHWGWTTHEADLDFLVQLTDLDGNVVEEFVYADVVTRPQDGGLNTVHVFSGLWEGSHSAPGFQLQGMVHLVGPNNDTTLEFSDTLDCTVAAEDINWGSLKATYR